MCLSSEMCEEKCSEVLALSQSERLGGLVTVCNKRFTNFLLEAQTQIGIKEIRGQTCISGFVGFLMPTIVCTSLKINLHIWLSLLIFSFWQDYADTELLLSRENVDQEALLNYAREAADFSTNQQLPSLDFAINHYGQPDVAMFDFTCMYASENAALVREQNGHQLLVALVGDSLLEVCFLKLSCVKSELKPKHKPLHPSPKYALPIK